MKKQYTIPRIHFINVEAEGLVASSGKERMGFSSTFATHSDNSEDDVLSNRRERSIWDEE